MKTPLSMMMAGLCFAAAMGIGSPAAAVSYQDWWWNPALNGMGVNVGQQGNTIAAAWYLYDNDGTGAFLTLSGQLSGNTVSGTLYRYTGPLPGPGFDPALVTPTAVGTASLTFSSDTTAVLTYNYDNRSGTLNMERFTFGTPDINPLGYWLSGSGTNSECTDANENGAVFLFSGATVTRNANTFNIQSTLAFVNLLTGSISDTANCSLSATASQQGSLYQGSGTYTCDDGTAGTWSFQDMRVSPDSLFMKLTLKATEGGTCRFGGSWGGVKLLQ
jgi:hypothetical protein